MTFHSQPDKKEASMRSHRVAIIWAALLVLLSTTAHAQSTLYDDFSSPPIDPTKWTADQPVSGTGAGLELIRQISDSGLVLQHRVVGGQTDNIGNQLSANRLLFKTPYTAVQLTVTVTNATVAGCSVPSAPPAVMEARSWSNFFNDGIGDITGTVLISQTSDGSGLVASGFVAGHGQFFGGVFLGSVDVGTSVTLGMAYSADGPSVRVLFQRDDMFSAVDTVVFFPNPPVNPGSALEVAGFVGNCTDTARTFGDMTAQIGNVYVNP
jgi:hypothetical protein